MEFFSDRENSRQSTEKDNKRRHHVNAGKADEGIKSAVLFLEFCVAPVLTVKASEGISPVTRKPDTPVKD